MKKHIKRSSNTVLAKLTKRLVVGCQRLGLYKMELSVQSLTFLTPSMGTCLRDPIYHQSLKLSLSPLKSLYSNT